MPFLVRVPALVARRLCLVTLLYLALPLLIFFIGWLRPLWGLPAALLLLAALFVLLARGWHPLEGEEAPTPPEWRAFTSALLWTWVPIALMVLQIGAGGFGAATEDWDNKHNLIFADIVRSSWPVVYHGQGTPQSGLMLVYYIGYYLPPAALGKLLGWSAANIAWQLWTQLGFLLVAAWLVAFAGARARWMGVLFLCFAGAELLGLLLRNVDATLHLSHASSSPNWSFHDTARWNTTSTYYVLYRSNIVHLFWTPQHLLAGWLGIALILHRWNTGQKTNPPSATWDGGGAGGSALLGWSLLVFWSPLSALGCLPFLLALWARELRSALRRQRTAAAKPQQQAASAWLPGALVILASALCVGVIGLYLAVRTPPPPDAAPLRGEHLQFLLGQLWRDEGWHALLRYGFFVLAQFGLMYALVWPRQTENSERAWRAPLLVGFIVLMILPCFIYGFYNDLAMRASIPATAVLCLFVAVFFQNKTASRARRAGVLALLLMGASTVFGYSYSATRAIVHRQWNTRRPLSAFPTIAAEYRDDPRHLIGQYTGPTNSPFARFLAK